jgi:hypothetical protein
VTVARSRETRTRQPQPPNGFIASATRLPNRTTTKVATTQGWQREAWVYYDTIGELRYLANWIGNVMSRAELNVGKADGDLIKPVHEGPAQEALEVLYGGPQGQAQMIQLLGVNLTVGGESYVVAAKNEWHTLASGKVTKASNSDRITYDAGAGTVEKKPSDLIIRVWTPHPTAPTQADAPTRSNLRTLAQIQGYDYHISAQLDSRLAGAGILIMPSEIDFAADPEADPEATQATSFMMKLHEAMEAAKTDPGGPASFVPIVVTAPGELIAAARHMTFWSELDASVIEMRDAAIRRFGIGMDAPPEVLMGNGDSNHWNAWLSEESAIKAHLEPRLGVIAQALTEGYLRPSLKGVIPDDEIDSYYVIADTAAIRTRPDRSAQAVELWDKGLLQAAKVLVETGFHPEDMMDANEYQKWLLQRIATGAVTPELTAEALRLLGAKISENGLADNGPQEPPDHTRIDVAPAPNTRKPPELEQADEPLVAACEVLVYRALERAGNKLKNSANGRGQNMAADTMYLHFTGDHDVMLAGSWDCAEKVLADYDVDVPSTVRSLDFYVRGLLSQQRPHSKQTMKRLLMADSAVG